MKRVIAFARCIEPSLAYDPEFHARAICEAELREVLFIDCMTVVAGLRLVAVGVLEKTDTTVLADTYISRHLDLLNEFGKAAGVEVEVVRITEP